MDHTLLLVLTWIEKHLVALGMLAILAGVGLGTLLTWTPRTTRRIANVRRRSAALPRSGGAAGERAKPGYQARSG